MAPWSHGGRPGLSDKVKSLTGGVDNIVGNSRAFAAKHDGSVVTWGNADGGGDSASVQSELQGSLLQVKGNLPA